MYREVKVHVWYHKMCRGHVKCAKVLESGCLWQIQRWRGSFSKLTCAQDPTFLTMPIIIQSFWNPLDVVMWVAIWIFKPMVKWYSMGAYNQWCFYISSTPMRITVWLCTADCESVNNTAYSGWPLPQPALFLWPKLNLHQVTAICCLLS